MKTPISLPWLVTSCLLFVTFSPALAEDDQAVQPSQRSAEAQFKLSPLGAPTTALDTRKIELGKSLFFDGRLSGDATLSCANCHQPDKAFTDGLPLSRGYPGTLYFRNTPSLYNVDSAKYVFRDGRLPANDLPTVVRDHISEAHFMQADGRLVIERMRQIPKYEEAFLEAFGGEPTYGRILKAVSEFVKSLRSGTSKVDQQLSGKAVMNDKELDGMKLFTGKAHCIQCHHGPRLSDDRLHNLGVVPNQNIFKEPMRHITFRRFFRTLGLPEFATVREDVGRFAITKEPDDRGRFLTPSLREVARTAPYMHNGSIATLPEVVAFYDAGGGDHAHKYLILKPLGLNAQEQSSLVAFLLALSSETPQVEPPTLPKYELRTLGAN